MLIGDFLKYRPKYSGYYIKYPDQLNQLWSFLNEYETVEGMRIMNDVVTSPPIVYACNQMPSNLVDFLNKDDNCRRILGAMISFIFDSLGYFKLASHNIGDKYYLKGIEITAGTNYTSILRLEGEKDTDYVKRVRELKDNLRIRFNRLVRG